MVAHCANKATARLIDGAELDAICQQVMAEYGFFAKATRPPVTLTWRLQGTQIPYGDRG